MKELKQFTQELDAAIQQGQIIQAMVAHEVNTQKVLSMLIAQSFDRMRELASEQIDNMQVVDSIVKRTTSLYANYLNEKMDGDTVREDENILDITMDYDYTPKIAEIIEKIEQCKNINNAIRDDIVSVREKVSMQIDRIEQD